VTLRGDFSFDAVSPDGRTAYLVQYTDPRDPTQYLVRALDARSGRLLPDPVVDPHEDADEMAGMPLTRTVSADGRWHYTLYHKDSGAFFVHALDTRARRAKCVDLPALPNSDYMYGFRLALGAGGLSVNGPKGPMAVVDTSSFRVTKAAPRTEAPAAVGARGAGGSAAPWVAGFAALMAAGLAVVWLWRRRATGGRTALNG
jgi:hypothetical protein